MGEHVVELKSEHKIYFHPLAPIDIPIQFAVIPEYARCIRPTLRATVTPKAPKSADVKSREMVFCVFSRKRWIKEVDSSRFVAFKLRLPNLTPSTNMNPTKNYYADIAVEMISDSKAVSRAISDRIPD